MKGRLTLVAFLTSMPVALIAQQATAPLAWNVGYTAAQAMRGEALYMENCAACHGTSLTGDPYAPPLTGATFVARWQPRPIGDLLEVLHSTMPQNSPGGLSRQQSADILAFILQRGQVSAGTLELLPEADSKMPRARAAVRDEDSATASLASGAFYTEGQAARGQVLFNRVCTPCHVAATRTPTREETGRGFWLGSQRIFINLGNRYIHKYPSIYHLFRRIRDTMPSYDADSVSPVDKVDIVAYMLQQNGFPAGPSPLPLDPALMKTMKIGTSERGFEAVFNGRDFTGIKFLLGPNCRPAPDGCGRTEPGSIFWVRDGELITSGKIQGYWYTTKKYLNFTLRFDYRFERPPDLDPGDEYYDGNSGYLLFINEHKVWPKGIEVQGNNMNMLDAFGMDAVVKAKDYPDARKRAYRPVGQWSSVEIVSKDGKVASYLNGELVNEVLQHEFTEPGHIAFQSEGVRLHWRNIRIKPE